MFRQKLFHDFNRNSWLKNFRERKWKILCYRRKTPSKPISRIEIFYTMNYREHKKKRNTFTGTFSKLMLMLFFYLVAMEVQW